MVENSPITKAQRKVLETGRAHVQQAAEHPDLLSLYRDPSVSTRVLAENILPDLAQKFPNAARIAVSNAIREQVTPEERKDLARLRLSQALRNRHTLWQQEDPEGYRDHQRQAALKKEAGFKSIDAAIRARGRTPWTENERLAIEALCISPRFVLQAGKHTGRPDYKKIAAYVNEVFHNGKDIRYANSVKCCMEAIRRKSKS